MSMLTQISDIDELILHCKSDEAQSYIEEAYKSYKAGAFRNSIVGTWIAVVFDIFNKVRTMASSGDAKAKKWIDDFENIQAAYEKNNPESTKKLLAIESNILTVAKDEFQLIGQHEYIDLARLYNDRNRCAHPSFQKEGIPYCPSAEQARYHLRNAIIMVLAQPPMQGKHSLEELKRLIDTSYFPTTEKEACIVLGNSEYFSRPTESLVKAFVDYIIYSAFDENSSLYNKLKGVYALKACLSLHPDIAFKRVGKELSKSTMRVADKELSQMMGIIGRIPEIWDIFTKDAKEKIKIFLTRSSIDRFAINARFAKNIAELAEISNARIMTLDVAEIEKIRDKNSIQACNDRIVELFANSSNWTSANYIYEKLLEPLLPTISIVQINSILEFAAEGKGDLVGSSAFADFLRKVYADKLYPRKKFRAKLKSLGLTLPSADNEDLESSVVS